MPSARLLRQGASTGTSFGERRSPETPEDEDEDGDEDGDVVGVIVVASAAEWNGIRNRSHTQSRCKRGRACSPYQQQPTTHRMHPK
jgi:hypothetical protein